MRFNTPLFYPGLIATLVLAISISCTKAEFRPAAGMEKYPPTESLVVFRTIPDREYIELGDIIVRGNDTGKMLERIKSEAMARGAQAIILTPAGVESRQMTSERRTEFTTSQVIMRAIAIRFNDG